MPGQEKCEGDGNTRRSSNDLSLPVGIPQAYLEYTNENWDPPSRWDEGVAGLLLDYNLNASSQHQQSEGSNTQALSGNGTAGGNLGSWRFRADWQANL